MRVIPTAMPEVLLIEPRVFSDSRGFFFESYNQRAFREATGTDAVFVQDNHSQSIGTVLRGLHYQVRQPQGKLVRVVVGEVFDVVVDLRRSSPHFGKWIGERLSAENRKMIWIPPGFGHGFLALSESVDMLYKATDYYAPEHERCIIWNDPEIGIDWPLEGVPLVSDKDGRGLRLALAETYP
jgi:dTDP-4-dehydrorhamnose 3,5-epimerase